MYGDRCVIGSADHGLKEFDVNTGKETRTLYLKIELLIHTFISLKFIYFSCHVMYIFCYSSLTISKIHKKVWSHRVGNNSNSFGRWAGSEWRNG
jgi:hypothetical protein